MKSPSLLRESLTTTIPAALMDRQAIARLLVVDDEPNVQYSLKKSLQSDWLQVVTASTGGEGIDLVRNQHPDAVILDVRLPDMSGLDAFDEIRRIDSRLPVIILTAYGTTETAIEAMKRGAFEYLLKPADFRQLRSLVGKAVEISHLRRVPAVIAEDDPANDDSVDRIIGETPAMREVYKAIGRVAPLDVPVLIQGESGTGKELVARAIYQHSRRGEAVSGDQLCRNSGRHPRKRVIRPREGRFHRSRPSPRWQVRAG